MTKLAVIGCGDWGKNSAKTLASLGALGAIVDQKTADKENMARTYGVHVSSLEDVLQDDTILGCVVATPTPTHYAIAQACLQAGKHVLLEKPFTGCLEKAESLMRLAKEREVVLMVGHLLRYHPAFLKIAEWVHTGKLGEIFFIETSRKNLGKILPHEGVHWDLAPHDVSLVLHLMGRKQPIKVFATGKSYMAKPHLDVCDIYLEYPSNHVSVHLSRLHREKEQKLVVTGSKGAAVFDDVKPWEQKVVFYENHLELKDGMFVVSGDRQGQMTPLLPAEPLRLELEAFITCIEQKTSPITDAEDAISVIRILEAVDRSLHANSFIIL